MVKSLITKHTRENKKQCFSALASCKSRKAKNNIEIYAKIHRVLSAPLSKFQVTGKSATHLVIIYMQCLWNPSFCDIHFVFNGFLYF